MDLRLASGPPRSSLPPPLFTARRRGRRVLVLAFSLILVILLTGFLRSDVDRSVAASANTSDNAAAAAPPGPALETAVVPATTGPVVFATYEELDLMLPSPRTVMVGYHEASYSDALKLVPVGVSRDNRNTTKFQAPRADPAGPAYIVQASRGRPTAATSAVDLVLHDDEEVLAPVTGRIVEVRPYSLYGRYPDTRVEIAPTGREDLRIVVIHVSGVQVAVGDEVTGGETVLAATATRFPFSSQVDRHVPDGPWPHVHLEVKRS